MFKKCFQKLLATALVFAGFAIICVPAALLFYALAWLISFLWAIDFSTWTPHLVIAALSFCWTLYSINTKEGAQIIRKVVTRKP